MLITIRGLEKHQKMTKKHIFKDCSQRKSAVKNNTESRFSCWVRSKIRTKIGTKIWGRCAAVFGSFWSLKTKILILYCFLKHFCALSDHQRRPAHYQLVDCLGHLWKCVFLVIWTILGSSLEPKISLKINKKCVLFGTIFWILFLDPFDHSRRKSWFCIVFYSTFAPWATTHEGRPIISWLILGAILEPKIGLKINKKCVIFGTIFWILFLDPFDHWRRKSWFCIVFYGTFAPWAIFENVFLVIFSSLTILGSRSKLKVGPKLGPKLGPKFEGDAPL